MDKSQIMPFQKNIMAQADTANGKNNNTTHPPRVIIRPIFWSLPLLVNEMPILRDILALAAEIPTNLFHEKPPLFIAFSLKNNSML